MIALTLLLCTAAALLVLEIFLPSGILGVVGGVVLLFAIGQAYNDFGLLPAILTALAGGAMIGGFLYFNLHVLPKTRFGKGLRLQSQVAGTSVDVAPAALVGQTGKVFTRMAPGGQVQVAGQVFEARSESGMLEAGEAVEVVGRDANRLVVRRSS